VRVRFGQALEAGWRDAGGILKPASAPAGYTPNTLETEWLTLNCTGAWAAQGRGHWLDVRFARTEDAVKARMHFAAIGLWC
jgi:hypothetical protein